MKTTWREISEIPVSMFRTPMNYLREWLIALVGLVFAVMILWVDVPPITDLPQHLIQVEAFWWALKTKDGLYLINWLAPNSGYYYLLIFCRLVCSIALAGKVVWIALVWIQLALLGRLARSLGTEPLTGLLAALLCLNLNLYWGFGNFMLGWNCFLLYLQLPPSRKTLGLRAALYLMAYVCHIFWLPFMLALDLQEAWHSQPNRLKSWRTWAPACLPVTLFCVWFLGDFAQKATGQITYNHSVIQRISLSWLASSALGALQGHAEVLLTGCILLGLLLGIGKVGIGQEQDTRKRCCRIGLCLLLFGLCAPDKGLATVRFSQRWIPFGIQLLVLGGFGWGTGRFRKSFQTLVAMAAGTQILATVAAWGDYGVEEVANLRQAIAPLQRGSSYLVLDYHRFGNLFLTRSSMHLGAYAQLERRAFPAFGFADIPAAFVRYRGDMGFTKLLEWYPERVAEADIQRVDYVLANGGDEVHRSLASQGMLEPLMLEGHWRLYRVHKGSRQS